MPQQQEYKTVSLVFQNHGLVARYAIDRATDPAMYLNLDNLECRQENALSSRYGTQSITNNGTSSVPLPASVHSLGRMKALAGVVNRFAGAGQFLYERTGNSDGAYQNISGSFTLSGDPWSQVVFEPLQSAQPYAYFFDLGVNLKWANGMATGLAAIQNGINPPNIPPILFVTTGIEQIDIIETFYASGSGFVNSGLSSTSFASRVSTTLTSGAGPGYGAIQVASGSGIVAQQLLNINNGGGDAETVLIGSISGGYPLVFLTNNHANGETVTNNYFTGTMGSSSTAYVGRNFVSEINLSSIGTPGIAQAQTDVFTLAFNVNNPANIASVAVQFNLAGEGVGSSIDYYRATLNIASLAAGWNYLTVARSAFAEAGLAGDPGYTWANVSSYTITVTTNGTGGATVGFDDFYLGVGSQLDVTGGIPYDYRMTWYNANTGTESNPTVDLVAARQVDVTNGSVAIGYTASPPSEATHWRLYRMGGSLSEAWYMVAQIPIAQVWYLDSWPDSQIVNNDQLALDNDPPVTSALVTPVNVTASGAIAGGIQTVAFTGTATILAGQLLTIDTGAYQEQVYVITGGTSNFQAYFQLQHAAGVTITATTAPAVGVNIACVAFGQGWAAGDPSNPSTLYYSKANNLEAWPPENTLVVGSPSDPIMGIVFYRGQLYVWTLSTIYQILPQGTSPPVPIVLGSIHGLFAIFGMAQGEGQLFYQGIDGVYAFAGASQLISEIIDWIITGKTLGPVVPIAPASLSSVRAAFCDNEIYFSYTGTDSQIHRIIYHCLPDTSQALTRRGWRNYWDLEIGEEVLAYDCESETCRWTPLLDISLFDYDGDLTRWAAGRNGKKFDFSFTSDHKWVWRGETGKGEKWRKTGPVLRRACDIGKFGDIVQAAPLDVSERRSLLTEWEASILGWMVTDGYIHTNSSGRRCARVYQAESSAEIPVIEKLLDGICSSVKRNLVPSKLKGVNRITPMRVFFIKTEFVEKLLQKCSYRSWDDLPRICCQLDLKSANAMLSAMLAADGHEGRQTWFSQKSGKGQIEAVKILSTICGKPISKTGVDDGDNSRTGVMAVSHIDCESIRKSIEHFNGKIWCPTTKFGTWIAKDNDTISITGNTVYKRWRNDDVPATAMLYEADTGYLIIGEANGNIYQDRVGDYDDGGWSGGVETKNPINIDMQTQYLDFGNLKADKYFSEATLDINTAGQNLTLTISYDNPGSPLTSDGFTVNTSSRQQVQFSINNGLGYRARRVAFQIIGGVKTAVTLYQMDVRVMIDEENRLSFDSGQLDFGTSEFKTVKQGWFEYEAPSAPITVNCYLEGTDALAFSFTLPQGPIISDSTTNTLGRSSIKVRFPPFKARSWRFVGTCSGNFKLYSTSFFEWKPSTSEKGYAKAALTQTTSVK